MADERPVGPDALTSTLRSARRTARGVELVVRLANRADRALHFISDVRAIRYDPATRRLNVRLTDEGRELIPGAANKLPQFRHVDPNSETEIRLRLPDSIVKLPQTLPASGELAFEKHRIADAEVIAVDVAWAETPFYVDPRPTDDRRLPASRWQQHLTTASRRMPPRRR